MTPQSEKFLGLFQLFNFMEWKKEMGFDVAQELIKQERKRSERYYVIDCPACKLPSGMQPEKIRRFTGLVQASGAIIVAPSILGFVVAAIIIIYPSISDPNLFVRIGISIGVFCFSCVMGTVGWLLISKRSVFLCKRCGYVMDRTTE